MKTKKEILRIATETDKKTIIEVKKRAENELFLKESQLIAIKILTQLKELNWTQKKLAEEMLVTPQQVSKWVSGKENLTIETLIKLQNTLSIPLLASFYEGAKSKKSKLSKAI